jgi:hypothetical protein
LDLAMKATGNTTRKRVADLTRRGLSTSEIVAEIGISGSMVRRHKANLRADGVEIRPSLRYARERDAEDGGTTALAWETPEPPSAELPLLEPSTPSKDGLRAKAGPGPHRTRYDTPAKPRQPSNGVLIDMMLRLNGKEPRAGYGPTSPSVLVPHGRPVASAEHVPSPDGTGRLDLTRRTRSARLRATTTPRWRVELLDSGSANVYDEHAGGAYFGTFDPDTGVIYDASAKR